VSLDARIETRLGRLSLDVAISAATGETLVLLGPNGAGKTTLLRSIAGLVELSRARVVVDGQVLEDTTTGRWVPTERRPIGFVFQDYLLFPHMSSLDNVAFGLRAHGASRAEARTGARLWLERVGLRGHAAARPRSLSGGEAQRVALARALAVEPRLLLLDEPLAALDAQARAEVRRDLTRHLASFEGTRVLVTHDPLEAMVLADRIAVLEEGRVVQSGTPEELRARPRSHYVARLVGLNLFRGHAERGSIALEGGGALVAATSGVGEMFVSVHPRAIALYRSRPEGSPRNVFAATVRSLDLEGDRVRVQLAGAVPLVAEVTTAAVRELRLVEGEEVWASVKASEVDVYRA
jgi:molybdate transport system ATP-binding protein